MEEKSNSISNENSCPLCGGLLGRPLYTNMRDHLGISQTVWTFFECRECGSATISPMPSQEELLKYYPSLYAVHQISYSNWLRSALYELEKLTYEYICRSSVRQLKEVTGLNRGSLLDVGGGTGARTTQFKKEGFDVTVLDSDEGALKVARERFGLKTICGLLEEVALPEEGFDIITFYAVLEHLPEPRRTLQHAYRLLRPNGWIIALVPLLDSFGAQLFKSRWGGATEVPRHAILPTRKGMEYFFSEGGLVPRGFVCDSLLYNAGMWTLSCLPSTATSYIVSVPKSEIMRFVLHLMRGLITIGCIPLALLGNICRRPEIGVFFAQKVKN